MDVGVSRETDMDHFKGDFEWTVLGTRSSTSRKRWNYKGV